MSDGFKRRPRSARELILAIMMVASGGACFGVLSTFVKLSYRQGFRPPEILISQFLIGAVVLGISAYITGLLRPKCPTFRPSRPLVVKTILGGTSIGFTGAFYYMSVERGSVSLSIVLLMQSIWMGPAAEAMITRRLPPPAKLTASVLALIGTVLSTNIISLMSDSFKIDALGGIYGLLAALSYTAVMWSSNYIGTQFDTSMRSFLMVIGGAIAVSLIMLPQTGSNFDISVFWKWGWVVALFGTILPPFLFASGVPVIGFGLAAILGAIELPIAIIMARIFLQEDFLPIQWIGVLLIIVAIGIANAWRPQIIRSAENKAG